MLLTLGACGGGGESSTGVAPVASPAASAASAPTGSTASTCGLSDFQPTALAQVNQYRAAGATCGSRGAFAPATALVWNAVLTQAAEGHSQDMVAHNFVAHDGFDGRSFDQRITAAGYNWSQAAENIAANQMSVDAVMTGWMGSEGHCANIMNPNLTEIGLACVSGSSGNTYQTYWTMDLGKPR